jgi:hypothetical protein
MRRKRSHEFETELLNVADNLLVLVIRGQSVHDDGSAPDIDKLRILSGETTEEPSRIVSNVNDHGCRSRKRLSAGVVHKVATDMYTVKLEDEPPGAS